MSGSETINMLSATAAFESGDSFKRDSAAVWDFQDMTVHRNGNDLVVCGIVGDVILVRGKGFTFEKAGEVSLFTQTGKIPSIRAAKVLAKSLAEWRSGS